MLLNNEEDNKKYFKSKEYNTIFIKTEKESSDDYSLTEVLKEPSSSERRMLLIDKLRNETGLDFLVAHIKKNRQDADLQILLAACWELAVDCSKHFSFFVDVALEGDFMCTLEVITLVEEYIYKQVDEKEVDEALEKINKQVTIEKSPEKKALLLELVKLLQKLKVRD